MNGRTNTTSVTEVIEGVQIPLEPVTNFSLVPDTGKIALTWTDPVDKVATPGGEMVAEWNYTLIIRREDRAPVSPSDGIQVLREGTRNQYSSTPYIDEGLDIGKTYYYAAYAYSTIGVVSEATLVNASPREAILKYYNTLSSFDTDFARLDSSWSYHPYYTVAGTQNNVLITGENGPNDATNSPVYSLTKDLVRSEIGALSVARYRPIGGSINGHAFFAGGHQRTGTAGGEETPYGSAIDMYTPSLTRNNITSPYANVTSMGTAPVSDNLLYAGGWVAQGTQTTQVFSVSTSMTVTPVSAGLQQGVNDVAGATNGLHAIFFGGLHYEGYPEYDSTGTSKVVAYDSSLTRVLATTLWIQDTVGWEDISTPWQIGCHLNNRAIFAGGLNHNDPTGNVRSFDQSLTVQSLTPLSVARFAVGAETIGGRALFVGGIISTGGSKPTGSSAVDVYDEALTRSNGPSMPRSAAVRYYYRASGVIDNVAIFVAPNRLDHQNQNEYNWAGAISWIVE